MPHQIRALWGGERVRLRDTKRAVTPWGGVALFVAFLRQVGFVEQLQNAMPIRLRSPNAIDPSQTFTAFLVSVLAGARRFAHAGWLRHDRSLHALLGLRRFATDDTMRNLFRRFGMGEVCRLYEPLWKWQRARLPRRQQGYSLDLDSTVFERYGRQQGALKGYNPRKHGRPSHHPLLAALAEAHFLLHGWLRSGNCGASRGVVEFLKEALALAGEGVWIRVVRADAGFFDRKLLEFLEARQLTYIVVARMTKWLKRELAAVGDWQSLDELFAVGEFEAKLWGWDRPRRFVVVRELLREDKRTLGRKLIDLPGYSYRLLVTNGRQEPAEVWRNYNQRADMENRIAELKYDLAADDFCLREFFATEAAFRAILLLFNLLGEFQRASGMPRYRQPATLRAQVFLCGAILGRGGRRLVLHLSQNWGGLERRNSLLESLLTWSNPTSPKLAPAVPP